MMMRLAIAAGLAVALMSGAAAQTATPLQKMETCNFGADSQNLTGAKRKNFMAKCMSNKDSPRGRPVAPAPR
jgi:hypothetical protein